LIDTYTVMRKELIELLGNRHSSRGVLVQAAMFVVITGVLLPAAGAAMWSDVHTTAMLYFIFPSVLASSVAADSFAGERERKTLETLLATPLPDHAIFLGKAASAVSFAVIVAFVSLVVAVITINVTRGSASLFMPPRGLLLGVAGSAFGASLTTASVASAISMRVTVARSAQQMASILSMCITGFVVFLLHQLHMKLSWALVLRIDALLVCTGVAAAMWSLLRFKRERFIENR
jgi:ABC-2 type transport system permease protein